MKTIKKKKTINVDYFVSIDGKEFEDKFSCEMHEESIQKSYYEHLYNITIPTKRIEKDDFEWILCKTIQGSNSRYAWFYLCQFPDFKKETIELFYKYYGSNHFHSDGEDNVIIPDELKVFFNKQKNNNKKQDVLFCVIGGDEDDFSIYAVDDLVNEIIENNNTLIKLFKK